MLNSSSLDKYQSSRVLVENNTGSIIPAFKIVQLNGMGTTYPQVIIGSPVSPAFGLTIQPIITGTVGIIYSLGFIYAINTSAWSPSALLYSDNSGNLVTSPVNVGDQPIAVVVNQDAIAGVLYVLIQTNQYRGSSTVALSGDVTGSGVNSISTTISANVVTNAKLAKMAAMTIKGNNTAILANSLDLTSSQVTAMLNSFIGDTGTGGTQGLVPAPAATTSWQSYFLSANGSFVQVDQSKPNYPSFSLLSQTSQPTALSKLNGISILGNYAYVAGTASATLTIYDISNQNRPALKSILSNGTYGSYGVFPFVQGGHTYVAIPSSGAIGKLIIVNVDNPNSPSITTTFTFSASPISVGSLYSCAVYNGYIYIASQSAGLLVLDIGGGSGSIASPVAVFQESSVLNAIKSFGVTVANGTVFTTQYVTSGFSTRQIKSWSITTPSTPSLLQSLQVTTVGEPLGVVVSGNTAFVSVTGGSGGNAVDIIDVTTPNSMSNLSAVSASYTFSSGMLPAILGNYLFVPSGANVTNGGAIDFFDITTRTAPIKIATTYTGVAGSVFGSITINNGYIYAADYGPAPGSNGNLDVFSIPETSLIAGSITVSKINYNPATPANWNGTAPSTIGSALDRIAALLVTLNGGSPIP